MPSPTPTPAPLPKPDTQLDSRIKAWLSGSTKVPDSRKFIFAGHPLAINILPGSGNGPLGWAPSFQAYILGYEIVKDVTGVDHLVIYAGEEDAYGKRYFVGLNLGPFNSTMMTTFTEDPGRQAFLSASHNHDLSNVDSASLFSTRLTGDTAMFSAIAFHYSLSFITNPGASQQEVFDQQDIAIEFANFSLRAGEGSYTTAARGFPLVQAFINQRIGQGQLDASKMPYISLFMVPISGDLFPSEYTPLPVTVNSDDYLTDTFVLAPGTYTVAYTSSGTCDLDLSVAILGSVSIPVVHQSVESEQVSGSVSITAQKSGSYMLDPGSTGCDWSVTISQP